MGSMEDEIIEGGTIRDLNQLKVIIVAQIPGFEDLDQFLEYCEMHCKTPKALFSIKHANVLYELIGFPTYNPKDLTNPDFFPIDENEMNKILNRIKNKNPDILYV